MTASILAFIGTIFAGVGLKIVDWLLNRRAQRRLEAEEAQRRLDDKETSQVADLKEEILRVRQELQDSVDKMNEWQEKYWKLRELHVERIEELTRLLRGVSINDEQN